MNLASSDTSAAAPFDANNMGTRVARGRILVEICFLLALIIVFNVFQGRLAIPIAGDQARTVSLLSPGFLAHLPWLNVLWGLALLLAMAKLVYGQWSQALHWADLGLYLCAILVLIRMLVGEALVGFGTSDPPALRQTILPQMEMMIRVALAGILMALVAGAAKRLVSLLHMTHLGGWDIQRVGRFLAGVALGVALTIPVTLLLRNFAYVGAGFPLGLVLGASLDRLRTNAIA